MIKPGTLCYVIAPGALSRRIVTVTGHAGSCVVCRRAICAIDAPPIRWFDAFGTFCSSSVCESVLQPITDPDRELEPDPVEHPKVVVA